MEKKFCNKCMENKLVKNNFYKKGNGWSAYCKQCFNKYCAKRWADRKIKFITEFGNKCADCEQSYEPCVYDFHHITNTKEFDWQKLRLRSEASIRKELDKCVLLCSNCHRLRHNT